MVLFRPFIGDVCVDLDRTFLTNSLPARVIAEVSFSAVASASAASHSTTISSWTILTSFADVPRMSSCSSRKRALQNVGRRSLDRHIHAVTFCTRNLLTIVFVKSQPAGVVPTLFAPCVRLLRDDQIHAGKRRVPKTFQNIAASCSRPRSASGRSSSPAARLRCRRQCQNSDALRMSVGRR